PRRAARAIRLGDGVQEPLRLGRGDTERLGKKRGALGFACDAKAALEASRARVLAQDAKAERMEGVNRNPFGASGKECCQPLAHFAGCAAGGRECEAAVRLRPTATA